MIANLARISAFTQALAELGWTDGRNMRMDVRWHGDDPSRAQALARRCPRIARNTMANANAVRDWRIYADFAQHLIGLARKLYANDTSPDLEGLDTVYALDSSTIDLMRPSTTPS
jgi:hypothetical protein